MEVVGGASNDEREDMLIQIHRSETKSQMSRMNKPKQKTKTTTNETKRKERKGKERKGKERKGKEGKIRPDSSPSRRPSNPHQH
ncbi:hypothetical protein CPC08DRAFT_710276 [Agrocybe pediades]|nr:hypothetical protein CPC08DRAFT_710276 [Agrocybe pediades]